MAISSMTGYGRFEKETPSGEYRVEIKSVNNRFLDIQLRNSRILSSIDAKISEYLSKKIARGSVTVYINVKQAQSSEKLIVDDNAVNLYSKLLKDLKKKSGISGDIQISDLLKYADQLFKRESTKQSDATLWKHLKPVLDSALTEFMESKEREAAFILKDMKKFLKVISTSLKKIEKRAPIRQKQQMETTKKRIEALTSETLEPARIAMETAYLADKLDIAEECTRLNAHIEKMNLDLKSRKPVGKKLGFLLQEMNREANTIGSKANDINISHESVTLKENIEKIREQALNLE